MKRILIVATAVLCSMISVSQENTSKYVQDNKIKEFDVVVYPLPINNDFSISLATNSKNDITVSIFDIRSRLLEKGVYSLTTLTNEKFGNTYQKGIYIVAIAQDDNLELIKIIKQ